MNNRRSLPKIGMRIIKSAIGVALCFVIYFLRGKQGTPFYSALAVLWCIQSHHKDSIKNAIQRTIGTAIGAAYGLIFILIRYYVIDIGDGIVHYLILSAFIIPIIYTTILLDQKNASYFSCVVYLSIVVNHLADSNPLFFVFDRSLDTMIGILLGLIINLVHLRGKVHKDALFVVCLDKALKNIGEQPTPLFRFTMTNLIEEGMEMTIATSSTPAAYLEMMGDIRPKLPIIAMDGAILYNINENSYPKVYVISAQHAAEMESFLTDHGIHYFTTVILEDVLLIYYDELVNEAEKAIYDKLHRSPYRNYLNKTRPAEHAVVYYMMIDSDTKIKSLLNDLEAEGYDKIFKILSYPSDDHPGYSYIKIYNKNATVENMIDHLKEENGYNKLIRIGEKESDCDELVNKLNKSYYWGI